MRGNTAHHRVFFLFLRANLTYPVTTHEASQRVMIYIFDLIPTPTLPRFQSTSQSAAQGTPATSMTIGPPNPNPSLVHDCVHQILPMAPAIWRLLLCAVQTPAPPAQPRCRSEQPLRCSVYMQLKSATLPSIHSSA